MATSDKTSSSQQYKQSETSTSRPRRQKTYESEEVNQLLDYLLETANCSSVLPNDTYVFHTDSKTLSNFISFMEQHVNNDKNFTE